MRRKMLFFLFFTTTLNTYADIIDIMTEEQFNNQILGQIKPIVLQFISDTCPACHIIQKSFEELANEPELAGILFARINIDFFSSTFLKDFNIQALPTIVYIQKREKKGQDIGIGNIATFKNETRQNIQMFFNIGTTTHPIPIEQKDTTYVSFAHTIRSVIYSLFASIYKFFATIFETIMQFFGLRF
jgi:thiol-disulfide isomerase/thioredoxin